MWDHNSPTRDGMHTPCTGRWSLNHWTSREVPRLRLLLLSHFSPVRPHRRQPSWLRSPSILQAKPLEWAAISFSNAWKWKVKVKSLSRVRLFATPWTAAHQAPPSVGFSRQEYWSGVPLPSPWSPTKHVSKDIKLQSKYLNIRPL